MTFNYFISVFVVGLIMTTFVQIIISGIYLIFKKTLNG